MRQDEEECKEAFGEFLRKRYSPSGIKWSKGDQPPDYFLDFLAQRHAVEITSLMESVLVTSKPQSELGILITIRRFLKEIETEAIQQSILNGAYVVYFKPIADFGKRMKRIRQEIMDYIINTQEVPAASEKMLAGDGHLKWTIVKYHSDKSYIGMGTSDAKWGTREAIDELSALLNQILSSKALKLEVISLPKILIIRDRYPWLDRVDWEECSLDTNLINKFHTIFLVSKDRGNRILRTIEHAWLEES